MFENGQGGVNSDHTPFDAMVNVVMSHFIGNFTNGLLKVFTRGFQKYVDLFFSEILKIVIGYATETDNEKIADLGISDQIKYPTDNVLKEEDDNFTLLKWKLDEDLMERIHEAKSTSTKICKNLVLKREAFISFGKTELVRINVNPDTFVQMAIQLAYMRLHKRPGELHIL